MLHVSVSNVHRNITFYYVHGTSYILGMCANGISSTTCSKVYVPENSETGSLQAIYFINIKGILTLIGGYMYGGIHNIPDITET